jgi:capsid protein
MVQTLSILDRNGIPYQRNGHKPRPDLLQLAVKDSTSRNGHAKRNGHARRNGAAVKARFDAAQDTDEFGRYWTAADALDADSANSAAVRRKLVPRSRYETANNGYVDGIHKTLANYLVSRGVALRLLTKDKAFAKEVKAAWWRWQKAIGLRRKLSCMAQARSGDGEGVGIVRVNPRVHGQVKLDVVLIETEQMATPTLPYKATGYIDGIRFDEWGNPEYYDILPQHPGGQWAVLNITPEQIPAKYVLHWFALRRAGQHRGVPELRSTMNVGASSRRWREATVSSAETAASMSGVLQAKMAPLDDDAPDPMTSLEIERRMMTVLPDGYDLQQLDGKHPNAQYKEFHRSQVNETGRPKSVPTNVALCDSSDSNFASGKLDTNPFHAELDCDRFDCEDLVLDKLLALWWEQAVLTYGWDADPREVPDHEWGWSQYPVGDEKAKAITNNLRIRNGSASLSRIYEEEGKDFDDELEELAHDFGVSVQEMRGILLRQLYGKALAPATPSNPTAGLSSGRQTAARGGT